MDNANSHSESSQEMEHLEDQIKQPKISSEKVKDGGFFSPEKQGIQKGVAGGIVMMAIALVWFVAGYAAGYIFYYPPILFLIGLYALIKGIITGNIRGEKAEPAAPATVTAETTNIRNYTGLFSKERYGLNIYVGIGYLIASMLAIFTWRIAWAIMGAASSFNPPWDYYIIVFAFNILEAALLVLLSHGINKDWALPVFFGLGVIVLGMVQRIVLSTIKIENMNFGSAFDLHNIIFNFI